MVDVHVSISTPSDHSDLISTVSTEFYVGGMRIGEISSSNVPDNVLVVNELTVTRAIFIGLDSIV